MSEDRPSRASERQGAAGKCFSFEVLGKDRDSEARLGIMRTGHGEVETPVFLPVGTQGTVKTLTPRDLTAAGATMILANTYHLYLRPGVETIAAMGGLHRFMSWDRPILTDSGGYQVFSLADLRQVGSSGVTFLSHLDGSHVFLSPEKVLEVQFLMGVDIAMVLDWCLPYPSTRDEAERAVRLTADWALRSKRMLAGSGATGLPAVFGILQGVVYPDLRKECADLLVPMDFDGYAIGGLSVGEPKEAMKETVELCCRILPPEKPRYLMGVGTPADIIEAVRQGVDVFDCVLPTRNSRNGTVFTSRGKVVVKNAAYASDPRPLDPDCNCYCCRTFSRAYLRHLFNCGEILGPMMATLHSVSFYLEFMRQIRKSIGAGEFNSWARGFLDKFLSGES